MTLQPTKRVWQPTDRQIEFVSRKVACGCAVRDERIADEMGLKHGRLNRWRLNPEFMAWMNGQMLNVGSEVISLGRKATEDWLRKIVTRDGGATGAEIAQITDILERWGALREAPAVINQENKVIMLVEDTVSGKLRPLINRAQMAAPQEGDVYVPET